MILTGESVFLIRGWSENFLVFRTDKKLLHSRRVEEMPPVEVVVIIADYFI
jgi:hypothetical protein